MDYKMRVRSLMTPIPLESQNEARVWKRRTGGLLVSHLVHFEEGMGGTYEGLRRCILF